VFYQCVTITLPHNTIAAAWWDALINLRVSEGSFYSYKCDYRCQMCICLEGKVKIASLLYSGSISIYFDHFFCDQKSSCRAIRICVYLIDIYDDCPDEITVYI